MLNLYKPLARSIVSQIRDHPLSSPFIEPVPFRGTINPLITDYPEYYEIID